MEPPEEIEALRLKPQEIGVIKEQPVRRWLSGQEAWDKKYKRTAEHVIHKRKRYEAKAQRLLEHAREQGLIHDELQPRHSRLAIPDDTLSVGEMEPQRRWGKRRSIASCRVSHRCVRRTTGLAERTSACECHRWKERHRMFYCHSVTLG